MGIGRATVGLAVCCVLLSTALRAEEISLLVPAAAEWFDTGIVVERGQRVVISASGLWTNGGLEEAYAGPNGFLNVIRSDTILPSVPLAALIGRVGDSVFPVGTYSDLMLEGRLLLTMNDVPDTYGDNGGYMAVRIRVENCGSACQPTAP